MSAAGVGREPVAAVAQRLDDSFRVRLAGLLDSL